MTNNYSWGEGHTCNNIGDEGVKELAANISKFTNLTHLELSLYG